MTRHTTLQTHNAEKVQITKKDYTGDESATRDKSVKIKIQSENDNTTITVHGDKNLSLEVTE